MFLLRSRMFKDKTTHSLYSIFTAVHSTIKILKLLCSSLVICLYLFGGATIYVSCFLRRYLQICIPIINLCYCFSPIPSSTPTSRCYSIVTKFSRNWKDKLILTLANVLFTFYSSKNHNTVTFIHPSRVIKTNFRHNAQECCWRNCFSRLGTIKTEKLRFT